jgi:hypothetical protein
LTYCRRAGLPAGVRRLLELAEAVPERKGARLVPTDLPMEHDFLSNFVDFNY